MKKIIAFSGSNSSKSINQQLVNMVAQYAQNTEVEVIDIRDYPAPIYGSDVEETDGVPDGIQTLKRKLDEADGIILSSPEHNGSMPTVLKNTLDWLSRLEQKFFNNKSLLLLSTSPGPRGGSTNLDNMKTLVPWWGANLVDSYSLGSFYSKVIQGDLVPEEREILQAKMATMELALHNQ